MLPIDDCATYVRTVWCRPVGSWPRRGPPYATDCDSDSLAMAREEQSRTAGHLLRIALWNAEGMGQKKLEFEHFLKKKKTILTSAASRRRIFTVHSDSAYEEMKYTEMTEKIDLEDESPLLSEKEYCM